MIDVHGIVDWLIDGAPGVTGPGDVLERICTDLGAAGVPVSHSQVFVRTLHPNIAGRSFLWRKGEKTQVLERSWAWLHSPAFTGSPMATACETRQPVRLRPLPQLPGEFEELTRARCTDFYAAPLKFLSGTTHVVVFVTDAPDGFSPEQLAALDRVVSPLARIAETFALLRTATNLLSTYVGRNAGSRILAGQIQLGDTDTMHAIIWFSDLRGFTALAQKVEPAGVIRALNELFGCQIPAIEEHGGEVLKFIGDGLLAIFPYEPMEGVPRVRCSSVLRAAQEARVALAARNDTRRAAGEPEIDFGVALHLGEISYGNIGGASRLDFTCIGEAVNLAARLEALASKVGRPIILSEDFAKLVSAPLDPLGEFELKGVLNKRAAFAPKS